MFRRPATLALSSLLLLVCYCLASNESSQAWNPRFRPQARFGVFGVAGCSGMATASCSGMQTRASCSQSAPTYAVYRTYRVSGCSQPAAPSCAQSQGVAAPVPQSQAEVNPQTTPPAAPAPSSDAAQSYRSVQNPVTGVWEQIPIARADGTYTPPAVGNCPCGPDCPCGGMCGPDCPCQQAGFQMQSTAGTYVLQEEAPVTEVVYAVRPGLFGGHARRVARRAARQSARMSYSGGYVDYGGAPRYSGYSYGGGSYCSHCQ